MMRADRWSSVGGRGELWYGKSVVVMQHCNLDKSRFETRAWTRISASGHVVMTILYPMSLAIGGTLKTFLSTKQYSMRSMGTSAKVLEK